MDPPIATIIVVAFNSKKWLPRLLAALDAQTEKRWRLVVFDNASKHEERVINEDLPAGALLIRSEENLGFAAGNNRAAAYTVTPFLVLLNPDAFPEPGWLAHLISAAERYPDAAAIGSTQLRDGAQGVLDGTGDVMLAWGLAYRSGYGKRRTPPAILGETFAACAAAMLVRRNAFEAAEGFDESYFCFVEDVDLCFRLRLLGYKILQSPDAIVHHVGGGAASADPDFNRFYGTRNLSWTFIKCMPAQLFWPLLPLHLGAMTALCTISMFRIGRLPAWRGFIAAFASANSIWKSRRSIQRGARARWIQIAARLAWNPLHLFTRTPVIFR